MVENAAVPLPTTPTRAAPERRQLHYAAEQARLAPSIHNSQPWRFVLSTDGLTIGLDAQRGLPVVDPRRRQAIISCGCALFNARAAIAACGHRPLIRRMPDRSGPERVATVSIGPPMTAGRLAELDSAVSRRHTNRRPFGHEPLTSAVLTRLKWACREEGAELRLVNTAKEQAAVAKLVRLADAVEAADPDYALELAAWTTDDLRRRDGVQAMAVPNAGAAALPPNSLVRDFDPRGMGWLPRLSPDDGGHLDDLLMVWTRSDDPHAWLRSGEALERVWLELTDIGLWASPVGQLVEIKQTRDRLRRLLRLPGYPQMALRIGRAAEVPPSRRRALSDVIVDAAKHEPLTGSPPWR